MIMVIACVSYIVSNMYGLSSPCIGCSCPVPTLVGRSGHAAVEHIPSKRSAVVKEESSQLDLFP